MTVDLKTQAVKGATVHFRCGGEAVIQKVRRGNDAVCRLLFEEPHQLQITTSYHNDGRLLSYSYHLLDIIRVDPPAFDWKTVEVGMAFVSEEGATWLYISPHLKYRDLVMVTKNADCENIQDYPRYELTRAPEDDIEVDCG